MNLEVQEVVFLSRL